jgi:hypothetical protein
MFNTLLSHLQNSGSLRGSSFSSVFLQIYIQCSHRQSELVGRSADNYFFGTFSRHFRNKLHSFKLESSILECYRLATVWDTLKGVYGCHHRARHDLHLGFPAQCPEEDKQLVSNESGAIGLALGAERSTGYFITGPTTNVGVSILMTWFDGDNIIS